GCQNDGNNKPARDGRQRIVFVNMAGLVRGEVRGVASRGDGGDQVVDRGARRRVDRGLLSGEVDRRFDTVELVEALFDPRRTRGAGHALEIEFDGGGHYSAS